YMVCRVGCTHMSKVNKYSAFKIRNIFRWYKTRICGTIQTLSGFIQRVLVRYVDDAAFICVNQKKSNMAHTISSVNGSYHENPVNNVTNHHNENQSTTNHIYLHPGHQSGEFENWMRKIGGLLQINSEYLQLKPLLDMIIALLEPSRLFLIPHPSIEKFDVKPTIEILLVLNHRQDFNHEKLVERILNVACMKI